MKKILFSLSLLLVVMHAQAQLKLTKKWQSDTLVRFPESVLFDPSTNALYVSSIMGAAWEVDGNGFISKLSPDGKITTLRWAIGLDAPKGSAIQDGKLYVADITKVRVIDLKTGKLLESIDLPGAKMLNDVTLSTDGSIYVSDSGTNSVYKIDKGKASLYLQNKEIERPNGLKAVGKRLFILDAGKGGFYEILADKSLRKIAEGLIGGDGLEPLGDDFILTRNPGLIFYCKADGTLTQLLDTQAEKIQSADISVDPKTRTIYVPTLATNRIVAYELSK